MMFLHSRFVIVDDKLEHLGGLKNALDTLRLDCHTRLYDVETVVDWPKLPGIRILFIDKNLRTGVTMGGGSPDTFSAIAEVIQTIVCPDSGPYGLVLWADEPELEELQRFLFERLTDVDPRLIPVFFAELRKGDYIQANGDVTDAGKLQADLLDRLSSSPQMKALFSWEADVVAAMDAVLKSIVELVPPKKRASIDCGNEIGKVLYRLSQAGAGINRGLENPREAINRVLVPILADRIIEHDPEGASGDGWKAAVIEDPDKFAAISVQAALNSAIHISTSYGESQRAFNASDLGVVVDFPFEDVDKALEELFGLSKGLIEQDTFFGCEKEDWESCSFKLVQIGAACDHAQPKEGPLLYLLGIEWPFANEDGSKKDGSKLHAKKSTKTELEWRSPPILIGSERKPGKISVFLNCTYSVPRRAAAKWVAVYRLREELRSKLTQEFARRISRPGILSFSPDN
jgi:hypothetical protein